MQRHTMTEIVNHSRSTALKQSAVKHKLGEGGLGGGLNRFYVTTNRALVSAVVGFLTHQCNISENMKIKQIQR